MLSNLKERLNSAVQNLAENERIRALQASRHAANTTPPSSAGPARLSFGSKDENTPLALSLRSPSTDSMSELAITNCANDLDTIIKELELANASNEEILSQLYLSIEKVNKPTDISKTEPAPEILTEADDVIVSEESVVAKVYTEDVQNPTEETAETEEKGEDKQDVKSINGETVEGDVKLEEVEVIQGESEMIKVEELRNLHEKLSQLSQKQTKWMTTLKNISSEVKRLEKEREESWKREKQTETLYRALEDKLKQKHNEWQGVTTKLTETSQALQQKTNQQNKSERDIKDLTKERDSLSNRVNDLAKEKANWRQEKSKFEEDLKSTKAELETVKKVVEEQAKSIKQGEQDISLLKTRNSVLDEENTTSRRLFSEKSDEYERVLSQLNQVEQLMRINADKSDREVTRLSERMKNSQRDLDQMTAAYQKLEISSSDELNRLKEQLSGLLEQLEGAQNELLLLKELKLSLEENASTQAGEITELKAALALQTKNMEIVKKSEKELDQTLKDLKGENERVEIRGNHLKTLNKALRDELRILRKKLDESARPSTPTKQNSEASLVRSQTSSPAPEQEQVNLEYLRHIFMKFIENKPQRPQLITVLGTLMKITPKDMKQLMNKL